MLRYWEQQGVVRPSRGPGGRRHFTPHDLLVMSLVRSLQEQSEASIGELRLLRESAEHEVQAMLADPLLRLRLLFLRQAAEPGLEELIRERLRPLPPPPPP